MDGFSLLSFIDCLGVNYFFKPNKKGNSMEKTIEKEESLRILFKNVIEEALNTGDIERNFKSYILVRQAPYFYLKDDEGTFYEIGFLVKNQNTINLHLFSDDLLDAGIDYKELGKNIIKSLERKLEDNKIYAKNLIREENNENHGTLVQIIENRSSDLTLGYIIANKSFKNLEDMKI